MDVQAQKAYLDKYRRELISEEDEAYAKRLPSQWWVSLFQAPRPWPVSARPLPKPWSQGRGTELKRSFSVFFLGLITRFCRTSCPFRQAQRSFHRDRRPERLHQSARQPPGREDSPLRASGQALGQFCQRPLRSSRLSSFPSGCHDRGLSEPVRHLPQYVRCPRACWRHESPLLEDAVVLSRHFGNHGYHAAGGGKIFHTLQWTPGDSQNDPYAWDEHRGDPLDPISKDWPRPKFTQGDNVGFVGRRPLGNYLFGAAPLGQPEESYGDHLVVDWAIEKLMEKRETALPCGRSLPPSHSMGGRSKMVRPLSHG